MTLQINHLGGGANGAALTVSNSAGATLTLAGDSTISLTFDGGGFASPSQSVRVGAVAAGKTRFVALSTAEAPAQAVAEGFFRLDALPTGGVLRIGSLSTASTPVAAAEIGADGSVQFTTTSGAMVGAKSAAGKIQAGVWYRWGVSAVIAAIGSSSTIAGYIAPAYSTTAVHSVSAATTGPSGKVINGAQTGQLLPTGGVTGMNIDSLRLETGTSTFAQSFVAEPKPATYDDALKVLAANVKAGLQGKASAAALTDKLDKPSGSGQLVYNATTDTWEAAPTSGGTNLTTADLDNMMGL